MKTLLAFPIAILALLFSTSVFSEQEVNQQIDAAGDSIVEIEHVSGDAAIVGWDRDIVEVIGTLGDDTEEFIFERNGKTIKIEVEVKSKGWNNWNSSGSGDDLVIKVPKGSRVKYSSSNADVSVNEISGGLNVDVINGDVDASDIAGNINLESVNGDIDAMRMAGDLSLQAVNGDIDIVHQEGDEIRVITVNGDIDFRSNAKEARVETVNGDMDLKFATIEDLSLDTVNGSIKSSMVLLEGASVSASSVGGSIDLMFEENVTARFDIEAHAGGRIRNNLTDDDPQKAEFGPRRWLEFSKGSPDSSVKVDTVNGRITIDRMRQ